jgi:DNA-binding response OmpR family regulator
MIVLLLETNSRALQRALEQEGFKVDVAKDATDADQRICAADYGVVVLERELLNGGGVDLLKKWRNIGVKAHVVMLTANANLQDKLDVLSVGADDYVTKPYAVEELTTRLRTIGKRDAKPKHEVVAIYDLQIDASARIVRRGGRTIHLTPREFELLMYLAAHRGQAVSRSMIWEHLYQDSAESRSNVVDVYIRYLRKKIDTGFEPPLILTCWGKGYMLRGALEERNAGS